MPSRPRVAYLITSYNLPTQVLRLTSVLRAGSPDAPIVVHHDDRWCAVDRIKLEAIDVKLVAPPSCVAWGSFSQLAMVLRCLKWTLTYTDFDWVALISGQDYPIRPVVEIERSLGATEFDALIGVGRCEPPPLRRTVDEFGGRYYYRWRRLPTRTGSRLARTAAKARPLLLSKSLPTGFWLGVRALHSPFDSDLVCHCGPDWFTLSRTAVEAVDHFVRVRPEVLEWYRRTIIPTESFVHTALANNSVLRLSGDNRRYTVWDRRNMTGPRVLRIEDLDSILASRADFARKFDETVDNTVLDAIDRLVHSGESAHSPG